MGILMFNSGSVLLFNGGDLQHAVFGDANANIATLNDIEILATGSVSIRECVAPAGTFYVDPVSEGSVSCP